MGDAASLAVPGAMDGRNPTGVQDGCPPALDSPVTTPGATHRTGDIAEHTVGGGHTATGAPCTPPPAPK